jgi:hypothetical protein
VVIHVVGPVLRCVMTTLAQPGLPRDRKFCVRSPRPASSRSVRWVNSPAPVRMPRWSGPVWCALGARWTWNLCSPARVCSQRRSKRSRPDSPRIRSQRRWIQSRGRSRHVCRA